MAIKKSDIYRSLWDSCDQLRGGMDASLYKDYILTLLFVKYVSDRAGQPDALIEVPKGCSFDDIRKLRGTRCLVPGFDGVIFSREWKEALWDRYVMGAPRPRTPCEQQYSDRRLRSRC
ncbi:hypothetical protein AAJCM20276_04190 [Acetobacter aceti]|uniref:N6 adenine-specific DNA methyltransferase N-terminal domain-containing protein n=2 Tax=Acetobacter aceti TaxID=435 RepID=A0A6S6PGP0_ACEAC|nr:type I restriction-modification system subunit M N-terminal domain-containing protein [Acetobacter aceti]BCI65795.1 hypothetical protein AAJCM20276_04190 [Acetobacter aceti]